MNDIADRLARLDQVARNRPFPNVRPRDAATLIIIDRTGGIPKVLLGRRHAGHKFMPGAFVFPGGRAEPADRRMPVAAPLDPRIEAQLMMQVQRPSRDQARTLALAAIRETFEETGLMIGRRAAPLPAPSGPWAEFADAGILPDLTGLHLITRAITPPGQAKRFDTRFFAVDATEVVERRDGVVGSDSELTELVWVPVQEAAQLGLMAVTLVVLQELEERLAAGLPRDLPVPFYRVRHGRFARSLLGQPG